MTRRELILKLMLDGQMEDEISVMVYERDKRNSLIGIEQIPVSRVSGITQEFIVVEKAFAVKMTRTEAGL